MTHLQSKNNTNTGFTDLKGNTYMECFGEIFILLKQSVFIQIKQKKKKCLEMNIIVKILAYQALC